MSLDALDRQITALRDEAARISSNYQSTVRSIREDRNLSQEGITGKLAGLHEDASAKVKTLEQRERTLLAETTLALEQKIGGTAGATADQVIQFRDAQDRAAALTTPRQASEALEKAVRRGDKDLARAYVLHAIEQRDADPVQRAFEGISDDEGLWASVLQQYANAYPDTAETLGDLLQLRRRDTDRQAAFMNSMRYTVPQI